MASADILRADHSPLPWRSRDAAIFDGFDRIATLFGDHCSFETDHANAAFIVRACNAHYQMLEALKCAEAILDIEDRGPTLQKVRAAIAAAEREAGQ